MLIISLKKQVGCFNYRVVTTDRGYERFALVLETNCVRQPSMQLPSSSYNHNSYTNSPQNIYEEVITNALQSCSNRAGGKGTAGTAMAVPVLREKKWRRLDSNLRVRYRVASPSSLP